MTISRGNEMNSRGKNGNFFIKRGLKLGASKIIHILILSRGAFRSCFSWYFLIDLLIIRFRSHKLCMNHQDSHRSSSRSSFQGSSLPGSTGSSYHVKFNCDQCSQTFFEESAFYRHRDAVHNHSDAKPFKVSLINFFLPPFYQHNRPIIPPTEGG